MIRTVKGRSVSVIQSYGCDQKGRRLSWETGIKQVGFERFPEGCDRGAMSYLEGERVPKNRNIQMNSCIVPIPRKFWQLWASWSPV